MSEALVRVKRDLGPDAVILHTRTVQRGGVLGIGARPVVEVTATADPRVGAEAIEEPRLSGRATVIEEPRPSGRATAIEEPRPSGRATVLPPMGNASPDTPDALVDAYARLIAQGVAASIRQEIINRAGAGLSTGEAITDSEMRDALARYIGEMLPPTAPLQLVSDDRPTIVALVGPTGVGKTTTIAKLAAHMKLREAAGVGLVTIDTRRIAAAEQLAAYARILNIPMIPVTTPDEMIPALQRLAETDLILIDTPGRSPNDDAGLSELDGFLRPARPDNVFLVLSSTASDAVNRHVVERFSAVGAERLIFTKLDEAVGFGVILNVLRSFDLPLSYVTAGPSVPSDLAEGSARLVADLILGAVVNDPAHLARCAADPPAIAGRQQAPVADQRVRR